MNKEEISKLIHIKEEEIKKIQKEIIELKKKYNDLNIVNSNLSIDEKVKIFMNYFRGRCDVYPYLSIDSSNPNKKYYIPKCKNEWVRSICYKTMHQKWLSCTK